jgi:galactose-1-phosphate uridylyltransferase (family 1)
MEFRQEFHRDVFIDVLCYRKYGHNEGDEPRFTQPLLYKAIAAHANAKDIYVEKLKSENSELASEAKQIEVAFKSELDSNLDEAKKAETVKITSFLEGNWKGLKMANNKDFDESPKTAIDEKLFLELAKNDWIKYIQIFENKGDIMGCSNPHPHGQIWAQSSLPTQVEKTQKNLRAYYDKNKTSLLKDYLDQELKSGERVVVENNHFAVVVPFWATWPYETMIISKRHFGSIIAMSKEETTAFAEMIKAITVKYDNLFNTSFPYSSGIHQAPTDRVSHPEWHFHMHFYPPLLRSATVKKFMVGYEMLGEAQRDISPEQSAKILRELSEVHYKKK